jgi:hypothetical protein
LVLADKVLYAYSLDTLLSTETGMKRGRKISSHVSYFKVGTIKEKTQSNPEGVEKTLVCFVRYNAMTSTIRALEPCEAAEKKNKHNLGRLIRGNNDVLKSYKALYIPGEASSIQFFKNIICVGSARGFQMVNLSSAEVQSKYFKAGTFAGLTRRTYLFFFSIKVCLILATRATIYF